MKHFFSRLGSYVIAILRLLLLDINFFFSGIHIILFSSTEITNIELKGAPLRCDRDKDCKTMAFLDKLCLENPDLLDYSMDDEDPLEDLKDFLDEDQGESDK